MNQKKLVEALLEDAALRLAASDSYRVLRRLEQVKRFEKATDEEIEAAHVGVVLDTETTGFEPGDDKVIEIALQRFRYDDRGRIIKVHKPEVFREDPGFPLTQEIIKLTGLTDEILAGQTFDVARIAEILNEAEMVIAHNAGFDRPHMECRFPELADLPWVCTINDVDWDDLDFDGTKLALILMRMGFFYEAHRAENDILAVLYFLAFQPAAGASILKRIMEKAAKPTWRIDALDSPFQTKDTLKKRKYKWNPDAKVWWKEISDAEREAEEAWLAQEIYAPRSCKHRIRQITMRTRYKK